MKISIDINDVIRDFSDNFLRIYVDRYNHEYNLDDFEMWSNVMNIIFPFKSDHAYEKFVYDDFPFELFGKCETCSRKLPEKLIEWLNGTLKNIDTEEKIEVRLVSPLECGTSIGYTYFFISKLNLPVRKVYFPEDSLEVYEDCDVLITANPYLLDNKKEGVKTIRIEKDYNKESKYDYTYRNLYEFLDDENNTIKLINDGE